MTEPKTPAQQRPAKMTPMLEQYFYWKNKYPDCVLFSAWGFL